jgi:hypothetical protein
MAYRAITAGNKQNQHSFLLHQITTCSLLQVTKSYDDQMQFIVGYTI